MLHEWLDHSSPVALLRFKFIWFTMWSVAICSSNCVVSCSPCNHKSCIFKSKSHYLGTEACFTGWSANYFEWSIGEKKKKIKLIELRWKKELCSLSRLYGQPCWGWPCAFSRPRQPRPLTFLRTAVPGFHTGKALCHTALSDVTSKSSSLALKTWIPSRVPGTPNSGSPVCEREAWSRGGHGTLWLKLVLNNLCTTELLLVYSFWWRETSKYFGRMRFTTHAEQRESCTI